MALELVDDGEGGIGRSHFQVSELLHLRSVGKTAAMEAVEEENVGEGEWGSL